MKKLKNLIKLKKIKWIVLLSKRGASNFNKLFLRNFNFSQFEKIKFACLSENIAKELNYKIKLKFFPNHPTLNLKKCYNEKRVIYGCKKKIKVLIEKNRAKKNISTPKKNSKTLLA